MCPPRPGLTAVEGRDYPPFFMWRPRPGLDLHILPWKKCPMLNLHDHPSRWHKAGKEDFLALVGKVPGFWPVDKPPALTSRQVVDALRRHLRVRKAGHTGTLDPFATGVLVVGVEKALKVVRYAEDWSKTYRGTVLLGVTTDSWDVTGRKQEEKDTSDVERATVESILGGMKGFLEQPTPPVSAVRQDGRRLYELAREGDYRSPPRIVRIDSVTVTSFDPPRVGIEVECGRGTYVRSIAWVLGKELGTGALLEDLRRAREGPFALKHCLEVPGL